MRLHEVKYEEISLTAEEEKVMRKLADDLCDSGCLSDYITLTDISDLEGMVSDAFDLDALDWEIIRPIAEKFEYPITLWFEF